MTKPAILHMRRVTSVRFGQRSLKMLRPVCRVCQVGDNIPRDWYKDCTHDPYLAVAETKVPVTVYEDIVDEKGEPTGTKKVVGVEHTVEFRVVPNWVEISLSTRVNSGRGLEMAQAKGFILPEELRTPAYPDGIAPICQFRECYAQDTPEGKKLLRTRWGDFCREIEAKMVAVDERGNQPLEVGPYVPGKRSAQLESIIVE